MQCDKNDRFQVSRLHMESALQHLVMGDVYAALDAAGKAATAWRNWREPFCVISDICFRLNDEQAGEQYLDIARKISRPEQAVLNEAYYDEAGFDEYAQSIRKPASPRVETASGSGAVVKIILGGDVCLGRQMPGYVGLHGPGWPFRGIAERLAEADLTMVNLETSVSTIGDFLDKGGRRPYYYHNRPEMLDVLVDAGIQVVCTANNHAMDYGREALAQQCEVLDACGFASFGAGRNEAEAAAPAYVQAGGLIIAFVGIETETPCMRADAQAPGIHHASKHEMVQAVAASMALARAHADIIIVSPHWGQNWREHPSPEFCTIARSLIDLGADAVLGHSAHILQGVELYRGRPIVYDMGTLLFDRVAQNRMRYSALFELELSHGGVHRLEIVPVKLTSGQAALAETQEAEYIRGLVVKLSRALDPEVVFTRKEDSLFLECTPNRRRSDARRGPALECVHTPGSLRRVPEKYRQLKSNVAHAELPVCCAWQHPVVVNRDLEVLGVQYAGTVRSGRGFICEVFFRAAVPPPGRWEARITALNADGETAFVYTHPVAEGVWPIERWNREEIIGDRVAVRPAAELPDGKYQLFWHLLDLENKVDMTVQSDDPRIVNGKVYLGEIEVTAKAPAGVAGVTYSLPGPLPGTISPADCKKTDLTPNAIPKSVTIQTPTNKQVAENPFMNSQDHTAWLSNAESVREGWQCKVYIFQHHVVKVLKTYEETWQTVAREFSGDTAEAVGIVRGAVQPSIALLAEHRPPPALVACFEVLGEGIFLQKRGENIGDVVARHIKQAEFQEIRSLLERTLELVLELWRYGLSETSWKFNKNFGVTEDGQVALLDCLELTGDRDFVLGQLVKKRWRKKNKHFIERLPPTLGEEFRAMAERYLTAEMLLEVWATKREAKLRTIK